MPESRKKISFWTLFEKFKIKVIKHFLVTTVWTIIFVFILAIIDNIISGEVKITTSYSPLLPEKLQQYFPNLTKEGFVLFGLSLAFFSALIYYLANLWEEELRIKADHYITNRLLDKFRQLPFEERQKKSQVISTLVEKDTGEVGYTWEHLPNHVYHSLFTIVFLLWIRWDRFKNMDYKQATFSFFWLILINIVSFFFTRLVLRNEKKYKKELTREWAVINKEKEKSLLIDSMGLTSQYQAKQRKISQKNENLLLSFNHTKSLNKTIPIRWLADMFPYLLIATSRLFQTAQRNLLAMWMIFENFQEIFKCFWEYGEYASSLDRINYFLSLPEKNDNLQGIVLPKKVTIQAVNFENVSFKYKDNPEWVLKNYTHSLTEGKINHLFGENGVGKSTILYLILGMLQPQQGKILIVTDSGETCNLQSINLKHWRENTAAYVSHDNLIEEGSTGQRQLVNLEKLFSQKSQAAIFLFDEADNALDKDNQKKISQRLEELSKNKLVVYTKH